METFISKYKPYYLNDFCMDDSTRSVIDALFDIDDLNMLFVGPAGSGKTTLLYSILREYYGLSKTSSIPETNILFINNLKEQGIQYYRNDMRTFCQSHCSIYGKKKMVVVDDLDTVNEQSQQVFRNYIDKYKHNINFIAVCTNVQKVIESIQSRVHMIHLPSPREQDVRAIMEYIIKTEHLAVSPEAQDYLWKISNGSLRVIINFLEKIFIYGMEIDITLCKQLCSTISIQKFENYVDFLCKKDLKRAIDELYSIYDQGYSVIDILDYFYAFMKLALYFNERNTKVETANMITTSLSEETHYKIVPVLCKYITIFHKIHEDPIELAFFTNYLYSHIFV